MASPGSHVVVLLGALAAATLVAAAGQDDVCQPGAHNASCVATDHVLLQLRSDTKRTKAFGSTVGVGTCWSPNAVCWDPDLRNCMYVTTNKGSDIIKLRKQYLGCEPMVVPTGNGVAINTQRGKCWDTSMGVKKSIQVKDCDGSQKQQFNVDPKSNVIRWAGNTQQCVYGNWGWAFLWWCHQQNGGLEARRETWHFTRSTHPATTTLKWDPDQGWCIATDGDKLKLKKNEGPCEQMDVPTGCGVAIKTASGNCWDVSQGVKQRILVKDCDGGPNQQFNVDLESNVIRWAGDNNQCVYGRWSQLFIWWCHQEAGGQDARREKWHFERSEPDPDFQCPEAATSGGGGGGAASSSSSSSGGGGGVVCEFDGVGMPPEWMSKGLPPPPECQK